MPIWKCCPLFIRSSYTYAKIPRIARAYTAQNTTKKRTSRLSPSASIRVHFEVRTDMAGRGALESPLEGGARTKPFDREFQFRESHTEADKKKQPQVGKYSHYRSRKKPWPIGSNPTNQAELSSKFGWSFASCALSRDFVSCL